MICNRCNKKVDDGVLFCGNCGNDMSKSIEKNEMENNVQQNASVNNDSLNNQINTANNMNVSDKANVGLAILSWFIPLAGLIIFIVKKKSSPKTAKVSGICALISALLSLLLCIILVILLLTGSSYFVFKKNSHVPIDVIEKTEEYIEDIQGGLNTENSLDEEEDDDDDISSESSDLETNVVGVSNDWKLYQVGICGKVYSLPMTYADLTSASGLTYNSINAESTIPSNHYTLVNLYKNNKLALYVELSNNGETAVKYADGMVTRISQNSYQVMQGAEPVVFPGGIKVGDTITDEQIIALFGSADQTMELNTSKQYSYFADKTWTTINNFKIKVINGKIEEIQLDHRG